jgi:hypothetical protein
VKYGIREAVARAYTGWDKNQADRVIAWLDHCGYKIVSKEADRTVQVPMVDALDCSTAPTEG